METLNFSYNNTFFFYKVLFYEQHKTKDWNGTWSSGRCCHCSAHQHSQFPSLETKCQYPFFCRKLSLFGAKCTLNQSFSHNHFSVTSISLYSWICLYFCDSWIVFISNVNIICNIVIWSHFKFGRILQNWHVLGPWCAVFVQWCTMKESHHSVDLFLYHYNGLMSSSD